MSEPQTDAGSAARLNYEINLECDACGHAQFLHCDHTGTHNDDPCGCFGGVRRTGRDTIEQACRCMEFIRPSNAAPETPTWRTHEKQESA